MKLISPRLFLIFVNIFILILDSDLVRRKYDYLRLKIRVVCVGYSKT